MSKVCTSHSGEHIMRHGGCVCCAYGLADDQLKITHKVVYPGGQTTEWGPRIVRTTVNGSVRESYHRTGIHWSSRRGEYYGIESFAVACRMEDDQWYAVNFVNDKEHGHSSGKANRDTFKYHEYCVIPIEKVV